MPGGREKGNRYWALGKELIFLPLPLPSCQWPMANAPCPIPHFCLG